MLEHRDHHLYQLIRHLCETKGQCTASRETLARAIGLSANSIRLITESWKRLEAEYLIEVTEREGQPPVITLQEYHESYYGSILLGEFTGALDQRETDELLGVGEVTGPRESDKAKIAEIDAPFQEEDFDLTDEEKQSQGAKGEEL